MRHDIKRLSLRRTKSGEVHSQDEDKLAKAEGEGWERFDTHTYPDRIEHRLKRAEDYETSGVAAESTTDDSTHNEDED